METSNTTITSEQLKLALEKAKADSVYGKELQKRLESGKYDTQLSEIGVKRTPTGLQRVETRGQELGADIKQIGTDIGSDLKQGRADAAKTIEAYKSGEQGLGQTAIQAVKQSAGFATSVFGDALKGIVKSVLSQADETAVKEGVGKIASSAMDTMAKYEELQKTNPTKSKVVNLALAGIPNASLTVKDILDGYEKLKTTNPVLADSIGATLNIVSLASDVVGLGEVASLAKTGVKKTVEIASEVAAKTAAKAKSAVNTLDSAVVSSTEGAIAKGKEVFAKASEAATPTKTLEETIGQVVQGKVDDIEKAKKAFTSVDTTDVKSYSELGKKFEEKIPELSKVVDTELSKDVTEYTVKQLATKVPTKSGKAVVVNYVSNALKDLKELYKTIGDVAKQANIESMIKKGKFTRKEVNDISRTYNSEFGQKAFSKTTGEPLTSVNAERYDITRSGLKNVARQGIGGAAAKAADETMSSIYNTQRLIKRNIEAVNKLKQRINERGLLEKVGHYVSKYADILTGGSIRGLVGGLLPRGAGYKVLNALDLEEHLAKNLKAIENALKSKTDDEIISQVTNNLWMK